MRRVTGIGGVFFKAEDPEKMYEWYEKHLGIKRNQDGYVSFSWRDEENPGEHGLTTWSIFSKNSKYFDPSHSPFMLNYRVENLDALLEALTAEGVTIDSRQDYSYGRFAWISDPEGNKIELWEPAAEES